MFGLDTGLTILLIASILAALFFEFINGFHDTANAVATVIYTKSLKPRTAVIWSGIWNFLGVYLGGLAVAMAIMNLLPLEILVDQNIYHNLAMIFALILTAIFWNLGTWYLGIPCSSSHTLLGSIFGVGIAFMFINADGNVALNWKKVIDAGLSLLISPLIGFGLSMLLMALFKKVVKKKKFFDEPEKEKTPPFWIRGWLVLTCTSVSYFHGSNDGQKGVGLIMIILISLAPAFFALDNSKSISNMYGNVQAVTIYTDKVNVNSLKPEEQASFLKIKQDIKDINSVIEESEAKDEIAPSKRFEARKDIILITKSYEKILSSHKDSESLGLKKDEFARLKNNLKEMKSFTEFAPWWVILLVSISLGLGTMIGWKRIVVTIGEKIGKSHLSYAQGASAEMVAASTIGMSSLLGLPVSTTHVLSSGVAGTMVSQGGLKNLQAKTVKNILIAWVVTIPVTVVLSCGIFLGLYYLMG
ncbi:MAG: inorganic phosphate transporter [Bacteroidales bacterium]|nr:MAG: inorganic phosphate transporter [Bacteroidales bacterium]